MLLLQNLTWMFSTAPDLLAEYGSPRMASVGYSVRTSLFERDCPHRPALVAYAPAYVNRYEFSVVVSFQKAVNFSAMDCGDSYG